MKQYDVIVLGGGISGLGVARATTRRGHSTIVLEAHKVTQATSNNTLRIIHGGFRYLQQLNLPRVLRSLGDQRSVASMFSEAVSPLPCLMPLTKTGLKSRAPVTAAALLYGAIMRFARSPLATPSIIMPEDLSRIAPILSPLAPYGALCWHDLVMTEPSALHAKLLSSLVEAGCEIRESAQAVSVSKTHSGFEVTLVGGEKLTASKVVNTLGPWLPTLKVQDELCGKRPKWCLGFNVLLSKQIHPTHAIAVQSGDGRLFFCVPRGDKTAVGTWYIPWSGDVGMANSGKPTAGESDIRDFLGSFNQAFPQAAVTLGDVYSIDAGILPMKSMGRAGPELYGSEMIHQNTGYCEVISTKYTTFSSQGEIVARNLF